MESFGLCALQNRPHRIGKHTSHLLIVLHNQGLQQLVDGIGSRWLRSRGMPLDQLPWESLILVDLNKDLGNTFFVENPVSVAQLHNRKSPNEQIDDNLRAMATGKHVCCQPLNTDLRTPSNVHSGKLRALLNHRCLKAYGTQPKSKTSLSHKLGSS